MPVKGEINSKKILIKDVFKMWFRIPEYQRPYVWGYEEINDLLDDISFAQREKSDAEYFLGSFVFQAKPSDPHHGKKFPENDLLDGQQRMTTLLLLLAVIRDLASKDTIKKKCQKYIYQEADDVEMIPERTRLVFSIRETVQEFVDKFVKIEGGTNEEELLNLSKNSSSISIQNMATAIIEIRKFFLCESTVTPEELLPFIANKVLMIYVATEDLEDAFRLFMILNDRGVPLRNSDILKSMNLGALDNEVEKNKYAKLWEEAEGELGDDFDRFLNHIRSILVKEKARLSLLQEFEDKIYYPKGKDKFTGKTKPILLKKGKETFVLVEKYLNHYKTLLSGQNDEKTGGFEFDNLIKIMLTGLPATDWMPPLLRYFEKFGYKKLIDFLIKLDNKFSADWIGQYTPTSRIEAMNTITKVIDSAHNENDVLNDPCFNIDSDALLRVLEGPIYGKRFTKYILLKLDYFYQNQAQKMHFETLSVEHVLPQNPQNGSQWTMDFNPDQRQEWTHKIGNLVLITRRKNASLSNLDYPEKFDRYFKKNIDTCPNSLRILMNYKKWTATEIEENHEGILDKIKENYKIN